MISDQSGESDRVRTDDDRAERLVRAAVSAFCSLTRPTRREAAQIDDLVLPLLSRLSEETRRFMSAALSECERAPEGLLRCLSEDAIEVAAPVLARSAALEDEALVEIAASQGTEHRQAILARSGLGDRLRRQIAETEPTVDKSVSEQTMKSAREHPTATPRLGENAENVRRRLRSMMAPPADARRDSPGAAGSSFAASNLYPTLRTVALTGVASLFQTALADALGLDFRRARQIFASTGYFELLAALRALGLSAEQAYVLTAASYPTQFTHPEAIRLFLERFELLHVESARDRVRSWKVEMLASVLQSRAAPGNDRAPVGRRLKAS